MSTDQLYAEAPTSPAADDELMRLGAEFVDKHRQHVELIKRQNRMEGELTTFDRERIRSVMQAKQELAEEIAELRATTIPGLRVKASVLLAYSKYDLEAKVHWTDHDELLGWSIARDLLGDDAARPVV